MLRESWEQVKREKGESEGVVREEEKRLKRLQEVRLRASSVPFSCICFRCDSAFAGNPTVQTIRAVQRRTLDSGSRVPVVIRLKLCESLSFDTFPISLSFSFSPPLALSL